MSILGSILNKCLTTSPIAYTATGTSTISGTAVDMQGFDGVLFIVKLSVANAGNYLTAQQGALANGSDAADLAGTKVIGLVADNAIVLDVYRPTGRYVRPQVIRGGATTIIYSCVAIRYNCHKKPTTNTVANVCDSVTVVSPALGTP